MSEFTREMMRVLEKFVLTLAQCECKHNFGFFVRNMGWCGRVPRISMKLPLQAALWLGRTRWNSKNLQSGTRRCVFFLFCAVCRLCVIDSAVCFVYNIDFRRFVADSDIYCEPITIEMHIHFFFCILDVASSMLRELFQQLEDLHSIEISIERKIFSRENDG